MIAPGVAIAIRLQLVRCVTQERDMPLATLEHSSPLSSAEMATIDMDRLTEIARRHQALGELIDSEGFDGILLQSPANFAWLTAGGWLPESEQGGAALFVTRDARVVVCNNTETAELFERSVAGLGFQLKERPWTEPRGVILADLCRGRKVASDLPLPGSVDAALHIAALRLPLSVYDQRTLRVGGKIVAHALEATARAFHSGRTEADLAGEIAHRLYRHGVHPVRLQVLADGAGARFRQWSFSDAPVKRSATLVAIGRFRGLHVAAARTVCVGEPSQDLLQAYEPAALVAATGMFFSQAGWELFEVWQRVKRIYEKFGASEEYRLADQASVIEYELGSVALMPTSQFKLFSGVPIYWRPAVGPVRMGETVIVSDRGAEWVTPCTDWPKVPITVKGTNVDLPGILIVPR